MRRVIKFGGTSLQTGERIKENALKIKQLKQNGFQLIVVVSAMGKTTTELVSLSNTVSSGPNIINKTLEETRNEIIALGETTSAKVMTLALQSLGLKAKAVTPDSKEWPVYGKIIKTSQVPEEKINQEGYASIDIIKTTDNCLSSLEPLLDSDVIPVICGFLAKDTNEKTITLGRGGSDITAFLLGRCLSADEVIIVTDVAGVLKGDPELIKTKERVNQITIKELEVLSRGGARVIHPAALQYKLPNQKARIVHFESSEFNSGGTEIIGHIRPEISKTQETLSFITVVGENFLASAGLLDKITSKLSEHNISIYGVLLSDHYIGLYIPETMTDKAYQIILNITKTESRFKAVSVRKNIGRIRISNQEFIEEPGVIGRIGDLLAAEGINIIEITTVQSDIIIFLDMKELENAYQLLNSVTV